MSWTSLIVCLRCVLLVVAGLAATGVACAQEEDAAPRVRIQRPPHAEALIDEAVVRMLGELTAVGLDVEIVHREGELPQAREPLPADTYGLVAFRSGSAAIHVDVWSPEGGDAYSLTVDTHEPGMNAEVVAVRAVEALRAKWLQYGELSGADLPKPVLEFARAKGPPPPVPQKAKPVAPPRTKPAEPAEPASLQRPTPREPTFPSPASLWSWQLLLGPTLRLDDDTSSSVGLGGSLLIGRGAWFAGFSVSGGVLPAEIVDVAGSATVHDIRYLGVARAEVSVTQDFRGYLQGGLGFTRYSINASAPNGAPLEARDSVETRFGGLLKAGANWWLGEHLGFYADAELRGLLPAFRVRMDDRPVRTLGAPSAVLGLGISLRSAIP